LNSKQKWRVSARALGRLALVLASVLFAASQEVKTQSTDIVYYWVAPGFEIPTMPQQSFVIAVDNARAAEIEAIINKGGRPGFSGHVAAGTVDYNKDYYAPTIMFGIGMLRP
jgi:hypothetical protein